MFSRSEKNEESIDPTAGPAKQRSPMVLAALAGLLAIAGAFLLVWYLNNGQEEIAAPELEASRQVLVVTQAIPAGTSVRQILETPTAYLSARAVPEQFIAASAITSIDELNEMADLTLASDALVGEQLLRGRFVDRSDFQNESFIDRSSVVTAPAGHHTMVLTLPANRALGGKVRAGDAVTVVSTFRVSPPNGESFDIAMVVLPVVEVVSVEASAEVLGQTSAEADSVGIASIGTWAVTLAVEPTELTDLVYAQKYGDIVLAVALPDAKPGDIRAVTTIDTLLLGAEFNDEKLAELIGLSAAASGSTTAPEPTTPPTDESPGDS